MDTSSVPIIKLELEGMKHRIMTHLGVHGSELGDIINAGIDRAIKSYDFDDKVLSTVHEVLNTEIDNFLKYGGGRVVIREAVAKTLNEAFNISSKPDEPKPPDSE